MKYLSLDGEELDQQSLETRRLVCKEQDIIVMNCSSQQDAEIYKDLQS